MTSDGYDEVDIDLLADYIGGALDGPDEAAVARLVADDPGWHATYELLTAGMSAVGADLRALGARPEPMPADVATRLEAALAPPADEPTIVDPHLATPTGPHLVPSTDRSRPVHAVRDTGDRSARRRRRMRWAAPIAAAAGVLAFAGFGIDQLADRSESTTSAAGSAADKAQPMMESASGLVVAPPDDRVTSTGTDYTALSLGSPPAIALNRPTDLPRSAHKDATAEPARVAGAGEDDTLARLRAPQALRACLEAIARQNGGTPITVQSVDYARYEGAPALIVRLVSGGVTWAWATGPDCGVPGRGANELNTLRVG